MKIDMKSNLVRAFFAATIMVIMTSGSTAMSSLFVVYRQQWGITSADIAIVFSVYVGTLLPVLLLFGGLAERFGRRRAAAAGILSMVVGLLTRAFAHSLALLVVARLFQGVGVGLSIGAVSAALTDAYRGKLPLGSVMQAVMAVGLFTGPVISAIAYNLGGGVNLSYVPMLVLVLAMLALVPFLAERPVGSTANSAAEEPYAPAIVSTALRFALPIAFVSWAGLSLFLSLVPSYLAATLHATNPLIGAGAVVAGQLSSLVATLVLRNMAQHHGGIYGTAISVAGVALLIVGTSLNVWALVIIATLLVGGGAGVASSVAFGIARRIGRGQRARVFARMYVAAYMGYSLPVLAIGLIAAHTSFTIAFVAVTVVLAIIAAAVPLLAPGRDRRLVPELDLAARAA
jgi:MFS family permease